MYKLRRAKLADREALAAMYRSFEPKGASLGMPPRGDLVEGWLDSLSDYPNSIVVCEGRLVLRDHAAEDVVNDRRFFVHDDHVAPNDGATVACRQPMQLPLELKRQGLDSLLQARGQRPALT